MFAVAFVEQFDFHAVVQKGQFADAFGQCFKFILHQAEGFFAGHELHARAVFVGRAIGYGFERGNGFATAEFDKMLFAFAPDGEFQPVGKGVYYGYAHAVQAAGDFVAVVVELAACVQDGHDDFGGGAAFFGVDAGGDAAPVVFDGDGFVGVDGHGDVVAVAGQRFVNGVVEHFEHHVVQAGAVLGVADIHAGAFAHGLQSFEDLDAVGAVFLLGLFCHGCFAVMRMSLRLPEKMAAQIRMFNRQPIRPVGRLGRRFRRRVCRAPPRQFPA